MAGAGNPTPEKCPVCSGTGYVAAADDDNNRRVCTNCMGKGILWKTTGDPADPMAG